MDELKSSGRFVVPPSTLAAARELFAAGRASDLDTSHTIRAHFERSDDPYLVDPHTAVGLHVAKKQSTVKSVPPFHTLYAHPHPYVNIDTTRLLLILLQTLVARLKSSRSS